MRVSAIIVTRGDVDLTPLLASLPEEWEKVVWDNGAETVDLFNGPWARKYGGGIAKESWPAENLAVYGRYAAIERATGDLIYVQDDDVVLSPEALEELIWTSDSGGDAYGQLVVNMPANFRHSFYQEHALVGFGAVFQRDLPKRAFERWYQAEKSPGVNGEWGFISRTCDIIFTTLTPYVMVDVPYSEMPWSNAPNRMWKQPDHLGERKRMLELAMAVRDAS